MKRILIAPLALIVFACAPQPAATPTNDPISDDKAVVKEAYRKTAEDCVPGNDHWRETSAPKRGGAFTRSGSPVANLDLMRGSTNEPGPHVYQALLSTRGCYYGDGVMNPLLATGWEIAPDGLTITLKLRDDVKWHNLPPVNGRPFAAADVASSIDYHLNAQNASQARAFWLGVTHQEPDARTVVLRLSEPNADFVEDLGHFQNVMLPREVKDLEGSYARTAIGTGPYIHDAASWKPENELTLNRNPAYYERGLDGSPLPYIDRVRSVYFADYIAEVAAFRSGQLDRTGSFGLLRAEADEYRKLYPNALKREELQLAAYSIWFNLDKAPWNDVRVRRAISLAIDREELIASNRGSAVYGGFVPSSRVEYSWPEEKKRERFKSDKEQARKLLGEAGYQPGSITTTIMTGGQYQEDAEVVQYLLSAVGINAQVTIQGRTWSPIWTQRKYPDLGWGGAPGAHILNDLVKSILETGNPKNTIRFSDAEVDRLAKAQAAEYDVEKRVALVDRLQDRLVETMPYVPGISRVYHHFYNCRVKNVAWTKNGEGHIGLKTYWLDQAGC